MLIVIDKRKLILAIMIIILCSGLTKIISSNIHTSAVPGGNVIAVDPGHGGRDPGAMGRNGKNEKDINLEISIKVKKLLESNNYYVVMTRESDISLHDEDAESRKVSDAEKRKSIINNSGAKLLVSIHLNEYSESDYYGAQVFYPANDKTSKKLAEAIQTEFRSSLNDGNDRWVKSIRNVMLIKNLDIPAVIVECGFLSNPNEERLLNDDDYQEKLAQAIVKGINRFLKSSSL